MGTLFSYFSSKEAVMASLVAETIAGAPRRVAANGLKADSLEEDLFGFIASGLRKLKPLRKNLPAVLETVLSPLSTQQIGECPSWRAFTACRPGSMCGPCVKRRLR